MKNIKQKRIEIISITIILVTGLINIYGYFKLPDKIATHLSITGEQTNRVPTPIYLILSFALVLILTFINIKNEKEQKLKNIIATLIIVVANIAIILTQI